MSVARPGLNKGLTYSNIVSPTQIDINFIVDSTNGNGLGIRSLKSNGFVRNVFMHTSATPGKSDNYTNPNPASGYALIQFKSNYNVYLGGFSGFNPPTSGSSISIDGSSVLTIGNPYTIVSVGAVPAPKFTVTAAADVSGATAGEYFLASDAYSNNYAFYNVVSGKGLAPALVGALANYVAVPVSYASGASATTIGAALATAIAGVNSGNSFSAVNTSGAVLVTSLASSTLALSPAPNVGTSIWTVSAVTYTSLQQDWQNVGLQPGLTPTVGQGFIATATGGALGTGAVQAPTVSQIVNVQIASNDPNQSIANSSIAQNGGAWVLVQFVAATSSSNPTLIATAPANNTVIGMSFRFDEGAVSVDGL
jgi:hypothetical protein